MSQVPQPVETSSGETAWIAALCAGVARDLPELVGWELTLWESGVRVALDVGDQVAHLDLRARTEGNAYATTPSLTTYLRLPQGQTATQRTSIVVRRLLDAVRSIDRGGLVVPVGAPVQVHDPTPKADTRAAESFLANWSAIEPELRKRLHLFSFLAVKTMVTDDLYPHMTLGKPISEAEIRESWRETSRLIAEGKAPDKLGIYLHIPYCTVECSFCYCGKTEDFTRNDLDLYVDRLIEEMEAYAPLVAGRTITSVYFGGGTPSLLSPPAMRRVFETLYGLFHVPPGTQVIFEGNPDSLKPNKVEILGTIGRVTRLTIGIQTLDPAVQKYVRRYNKKEDVEAAMNAARAVGIPHVNFDCIGGLQGQSMESFQHDILYLLSLNPDSIHLNGFRPLPRTLFSQKGRELVPGQEALRDRMIAWGEEALEAHGHKQSAEQGLHRTHNAANLQEYDLRKQNSSLMGFGYPARSHSFGGWYYEREKEGGFVPALRQQNAGERRYQGVRADLTEEMHKFLVTNVRGGFVEQEFIDLFGKSPFDVAPEGFALLERIGALTRIHGRILMHTGRLLDALVLRPFFYSPAMLERAMEVWGNEYDPNEDYLTQLGYMVPAAD